jgi:hypothetical protein
LITYENRLIPLTDISFIQRTPPLHQQHLQLLEKNPNTKSVFGVVGSSPLNDLHHFHATNAFPGDAMHDYLEGK